ncbi:hypothetical protein GCM10010206_79250 [Streptomyces cinerochromogenes]|nr:hypothetical protein GCM10010206_79250 [Streptomyces cinerochromogenes]
MPAMCLEWRGRSRRGRVQRCIEQIGKELQLKLVAYNRGSHVRPPRYISGPLRQRLDAIWTEWQREALNLGRGGGRENAGTPAVERGFLAVRAPVSGGLAGACSRPARRVA